MIGKQPCIGRRIKKLQAKKILAKMLKTIVLPFVL